MGEDDAPVAVTPPAHAPAPAVSHRRVLCSCCPAQRLLEAERRFAEQLKREEDAKMQTHRRGMATAEEEQRSFGDKFWGKQIVEAELVRAGGAEVPATTPGMA